MDCARPAHGVARVDCGLQRAGLVLASERGRPLEVVSTDPNSSRRDDPVRRFMSFGIVLRGCGRRSGVRVARPRRARPEVGQPHDRRSEHAKHLVPVTIAVCRVVIHGTPVRVHQSSGRAPQLESRERPRRILLRTHVRVNVTLRRSRCPWRDQHVDESRRGQRPLDDGAC